MANLRIVPLTSKLKRIRNRFVALGGEHFAKRFVGIAIIYIACATDDRPNRTQSIVQVEVFVCRMVAIVLR
jgi:hypothetical protein